MTQKESLIKFPCHFPIKIIGTKTAIFADQIKDITLKHFPLTQDQAIVHQESQKGNYLSITVTVFVHDQESLNLFYEELTKHPDIKMVL